MDWHRKIRLVCWDGMSERAVARHFGISCESVRKMLGCSVPPGYRRTAPIRRPKRNGFTAIIDGWLKDGLDQARRQRHTTLRDRPVYHRDIVEAGNQSCCFKNRSRTIADTPAARLA